MSWENFQEDAYRLTKEETKKLTASVLKNYREAIKTIDAQLKNVYAKLTEVDPDDYYNEVLKRDRLEALLKQVRYDYSLYSMRSQRDIINILKVSFSNVYYRKLFAANWLTEKTVFGFVPARLNELSVLGTNQAWKNIKQSIVNKYGSMNNYIPQKGSLSALLKKNRVIEIEKIQSSITQGLINGDSYTKTSNSIKDIIGREYKDGKVTKITGSKASALKVVRTESNRIMNAGNYASEKELDASGVNIKRQLVSTLDIRTRRQSAIMDGQRVKVDEPFRYPGGVKAMLPGTTGVEKFDINDREAVATIVNDKDPAVRIGRNPKTGENEYFNYKDFDTWAKDNGLTKNIYGEYIGK